MQAKTSGTSSLPTLLPLPRPITVDDFPGISGMFCYIVKHYGHAGLSLLIKRDGDNVAMIVGDWDGNAIPLDNPKHPLASAALECLNNTAIISYQVLKHIGVPQSILYFAFQDGGLVLVDVRVSLNKFFGPGMLQDVFGKVLHTQDVIGIESLSEKVMDSILTGRDIYAPSIILKPSRFRFASIGSDPVPLYVEVLR